MSVCAPPKQARVGVINTAMPSVFGVGERVDVGGAYTKLLEEALTAVHEAVAVAAVAVDVPVVAIMQGQAPPSA